jgi:gluconolactonase
MTEEHKDIKIYDHIAVPAETIQVEKLATGFHFTEGPVWHPNGYLLFSDIPANRIWQLSPAGIVKIHLDYSGFTGDDTSELSEQIGSNGLAIDQQQNLIICQHGNHAIAMFDRFQVLSALVGTYHGRRFNSPNDLVIKSDGSIYFTDPPYGLKDQVAHPNSFQPVAGIYLYKDGKVSLVSDDLRYPNGVCFSPDEKCLYVSSNHPDEPYLWCYHVNASGELENPSVLIEQNADGIKTDDEGNLYLCTDDGLLLVSAEGKRKILIPLPETPANIAWERPGHSTLYVTARSSIYKITGFK